MPTHSGAPSRWRARSRCRATSPWRSSRPAAAARGAVRDAARLRVRHADGRGVSRRVARASWRCPHRWQPMYTRASMAMGYEFGVTPVQLAAAYAAIANDGVLLAPTLVREVRDPAGNVLYRHQPGAGAAGGILGDRRAAARVSAGGGGRRRHGRRWRSSPTTPCWARPARAIRFEDGRYVRGQYTASFAAIFPADHPQLVVDREDR